MRAIKKIRFLARVLSGDTRGLSAIEFAMLFPAMIAMYIGAAEISHALTVDRRVTSIASAAADLVAQAEEITSDDLQDVFGASTSIMAPYSAGSVSIVLTSVEADENNDTTVAWSCAHNGAPRAVGSEYPLPGNLTQPFTSVIVAEVSYSYTPPLGHYITNGINLTETFYLRPRRSLSVQLQGGC